MVETTAWMRRVDQLAAESGLGVRTLQRLFRRVRRSSPKWVIQRRRLLDAAELVHAGEQRGVGRAGGGARATATRRTWCGTSPPPWAPRRAAYARRRWPTAVRWRLIGSRAWCTVSALSTYSGALTDATVPAPSEPSRHDGPAGLCAGLRPRPGRGCSGSDATPPPVKIGPGPGLPKVGACRVLTLDDITPASNETPIVPCSEPHTSVTMAVGTFTAAQITNKRLADGTIGNLALQRCTDEWKKTVGGTVSSQHTSLLGLAYFLPNQIQLSNGARWYRCDVDPRWAGRP